MVVGGLLLLRHGARTVPHAARSSRAGTLGSWYPGVNAWSTSVGLPVMTYQHMMSFSTASEGGGGGRGGRGRGRGAAAGGGPRKQKRRPPQQGPSSSRGPPPPKPRWLQPPPPPRPPHSSSSGRGGGQSGAGGGGSNRSHPADQDENRPRNRQPFVKVRFEPEEWDLDKTDPLYVPRRRDKAKLISAEDFANRPQASFSNEFASPYEARIVFSWLRHETCDDIYAEYVSMMERMKADHDREQLMNHQEKDKTQNTKTKTKSNTSSAFLGTSHEYITHILARKYNLMPDRVAGIITLAHNEQQLRRTHPEYIHYDTAKDVDDATEALIREIYAHYDQVNPEEYVETRVDADVTRGEPEEVVVDDEVDLDKMEKDAILRERDVAQRLIDNKYFIEDVDETEVEVRVNGECRRLMEAREVMMQGKLPENFIKTRDKTKTKTKAAKHADKELEGEDLSSETEAKVQPQEDDKSKEDAQPPQLSTAEAAAAAIAAAAPPPNGEPRRPRWKYAAHTINTGSTNTNFKSKRKMKKQRRQLRIGNWMAKRRNTLVEEGGTLRVATVDEVEATAWKSERNVKEFMLKDVKRAWVERNKADAGEEERAGWGHVAVPPA